MVLKISGPSKFSKHAKHSFCVFWSIWKFLAPPNFQNLPNLQNFDLDVSIVFAVSGPSKLSKPSDLGLICFERFGNLWPLKIFKTFKTLFGIFLWFWKFLDPPNFQNLVWAFSMVLKVSGPSKFDSAGYDGFENVSPFQTIKTFKSLFGEFWKFLAPPNLQETCKTLFWMFWMFLALPNFPNFSKLSKHCFERSACVWNVWPFQTFKTFKICKTFKRLCWMLWRSLAFPNQQSIVLSVLAVTGPSKLSKHSRPGLESFAGLGSFWSLQTFKISKYAKPPKHGFVDFVDFILYLWCIYRMWWFLI